MNRENWWTVRLLAALGFVFWGVASLDAADADDWKEFSPKGGSFSVKFPAKTTSGKTGDKANDFKTERAVADGMGYTLYWRVQEKPFENADEEDTYLKNQQKGVAAAGKLIDEKAIAVAGYKGREFTVNVKDKVILRCRAFVIGKSVCTLVVQGGSAEAVKHADAETFFKSLKPATKKKEK